MKSKNSTLNLICVLPLVVMLAVGGYFLFQDWRVNSFNQPEPYFRDLLAKTSVTPGQLAAEVEAIADWAPQGEGFGVKPPPAIAPGFAKVVACCPPRTKFLVTKGHDSRPSSVWLWVPVCQMPWGLEPRYYFLAAFSGTEEEISAQGKLLGLAGQSFLRPDVLVAHSGTQK